MRTEQEIRERIGQIRNNSTILDGFAGGTIVTVEQDIVAIYEQERLRKSHLIESLEWVLGENG